MNGPNGCAAQNPTGPLATTYEWLARHSKIIALAKAADGRFGRDAHAPVARNGKEQ